MVSGMTATMGDIGKMVGVFGVGIFFLFAGLNAICVVVSLIKHEHHSMIPLIGGLSGFLGCLAIPSLRPFAVVPLLLDLGTASFLFFGLPVVVWEGWRTCRCNLLQEYVGFGERKKVRLRLFRQNIFVLEQKFERKKGEYGMVACSTIGKWSGADGDLHLIMGEEEAVYRTVHEHGHMTLHQTIGFHSYEKRQDMALGEVPLQLTYPLPERTSG
jgi:hypothetical protein